MKPTVTEPCDLLLAFDSLRADRMLLLLLLLPLSAASASCVSMTLLDFDPDAGRHLELLSAVSGAADDASCGQLCLREPRCRAIGFAASDRLCLLLRGHLKEAGASANVGPLRLWAVHGTGFGKCSSAFNLTWGRSRYRILTSFINSWAEAVERCEEEGGKLAEIITQVEAQAVTSLIYSSLSRLGFTTWNFFVGAQQEANYQSARDAWIWYHSRIPVSREMLASGEFNDNDRRSSGYMSYYSSHNYTKLRDTYTDQKSPAICECINLD